MDWLVQSIFLLCKIKTILGGVGDAVLDWKFSSDGNYVGQIYFPRFIKIDLQNNDTTGIPIWCDNFQFSDNSQILYYGTKIGGLKSVNFSNFTEICSSNIFQNGVVGLFSLTKDNKYLLIVDQNNQLIYKIKNCMTPLQKSTLISSHIAQPLIRMY